MMVKMQQSETPWLPKEERIRIATPYQVGTLAYLDTFSGLIKCRVTKILDNNANGIYHSGGKVEVELMETIGAYKKGEILEWTAVYVPPRAQVKRNRIKGRILTNYKYVKEEDDMANTGSSRRSL